MSSIFVKLGPSSTVLRVTPKEFGLIFKLGIYLTGGNDYDHVKTCNNQLFGVL